MDVGPVEVIVLEFPGQRADPAVTGVLTDVVSRGYAAVLDLVFVAHTPDGSLRVTDVGDNLDGVGLGALQPGRQPLISRDDLDLMRDSLRPGTCAAVIAYEHRWPERLAVTEGRRSCLCPGTGSPGCSARSPAATWSRPARR
jgi:hypothetical protein